MDVTDSYSKDLKTSLHQLLARLILTSSGMLFSNAALAHPILDVVDMVDMAYCFTKANSTKKLSHLIQMVETYHHPIHFTTPPQSIAQVIEHVTNRFAKPDNCFCMDTVQNMIERINLPDAEGSMTAANGSNKSIQMSPSTPSSIYSQAINQENLEKAVYFYKDGDEIVFGAAEEHIIEKSTPKTVAISKPNDTLPLNSQSIVRINFDNVIADTTLGKSISFISGNDRNAVDMMANMTRALASRYSDGTENWSDEINIGEMPMNIDFALNASGQRDDNVAAISQPQNYSAGALTIALSEPIIESSDKPVIAEIQNGLELVLSMLDKPYCQAEQKIEKHDQPIIASKTEIQNGLELVLSMLDTPYCQPAQIVETHDQPIIADKTEIQNGLELALGMLDTPYCQTEKQVVAHDEPIVASAADIQNGLELALSILATPYCVTDTITYASIEAKPSQPTLAKYTDILDVPEINLSMVNAPNYCDTAPIQS